MGRVSQRQPLYARLLGGYLISLMASSWKRPIGVECR